MPRNTLRFLRATLAAGSKRTARIESERKYHAQGAYIGYVLAVVSIILSSYVSWYFYEKSLQFRDLHYSTDTFPNTVYDASGKTKPPFTVTDVQGNQITESVYLSTHTIWNNGTQPILAADILQPIEISLETVKSAILAVSTTKASRAITGCSVTLDKKSNRSFIVSFRVLEPQDGCLIQLFTTGQQYPPIKVTGEIVGTKKITLHSETVGELFSAQKKWRFLTLVSKAILAFAFILVLFLYLRTQQLKPFSLYLRLLAISLAVVEVAFTAELVLQPHRIAGNKVPEPNIEKWVVIEPDPVLPPAIPKNVR